MNASILLRDKRVAAGWSQFATKAAPILPNETDAAARLASAQNIDFCDALEIVRGRQYEREEMLDGRERYADTNFGG